MTDNARGVSSPELYHGDVRGLRAGVVVRDLYGNLYERFGDRWFTPGSEVGYPHAVIQTPVYILWTPTRQAVPSPQKVRKRSPMGRFAPTATNPKTPGI